MPANAIHGHTIGHFAVAVMEHQFTRIKPLHRLADMVRREGPAQHIVTHARPRGIGHLCRLHMQHRIGKKMQTTRMIVM
jgi:hypothetical protein